MQLGISSYTFGWAVQDGNFDADALLDEAVSAGVSVVQFGDNMPLHVLDNDTLKDLKYRAAHEGIAIETGARGLTLAHLQRYIELSHQLKAKVLRFVVDDGNYQPSVDEIIHVLNQVKPDLGEVQIGLENHDRFSAATLAHIVTKVDSPKVGICLDTANSLGAGEGLSKVLHHLAPHTINLHIKDFMIERVPYLMGFTVEGRPAGEGMINYTQLLNSLNPTRCKTAVLELWTPPQDTPKETIETEKEWARRSLDFLRDLGQFE